jgi:hypothetical protein
MTFVNLCILLGIPLALLGLRWFFIGPPDPNGRDDRGTRPPWD